MALNRFCFLIDSRYRSVWDFRVTEQALGDNNLTYFRTAFTQCESLRIYEGTSEVQKMVISREVLSGK